MVDNLGYDLVCALPFVLASCHSSIEDATLLGCSPFLCSTHLARFRFGLGVVERCRRLTTKNSKVSRVTPNQRENA